MKRREVEYRQRVAELAKQVCDGQLNFFAFLSEVAGKENTYEIGDDEVNEPIDLLEHEPAKDDIFGIGETKHQEYMQRIYELIARLQT